MQSVPFPPRQRSRHAFTLIELLVVIAIIAVLAGLSLPVINGMKESGNSTKCISNLKQIGTALNLYCADNNNYYPQLTSADGSRDWDTDAINPYLPERTNNGRQSVIFICPSAKFAGSTTSDLSRCYTATDCMAAPAAANYSYKTPNSRNALNSLTTSLLLFDGAQWGTNRYCKVNVSWPDVSASGDLGANSRTNTYIDYRHRGTFNGLYADGHVDKLSRAFAAANVKITNWRANNQ